MKIYIISGSSPGGGGILDLCMQYAQHGEEFGLLLNSSVNPNLECKQRLETRHADHMSTISFICGQVKLGSAVGWNNLNLNRLKRHGIIVFIAFA